MRGWWSFGLAVLACTAPVPLGTYRVPIQTGSQSVALETMIVSVNGGSMTLFDADSDSKFGVGQGSVYSNIPFRFTVPEAYPLAIDVSAQYIQDQGTRPYETIAIAPLDLGATGVTRVTLTSGSQQLTLISSGGNYYSETAEPQPPLTELPGPLFALSSVAGAGLWLPTNTGVTVWEDAMTTFTPASATNPGFCGAPVASKLESSQVTVLVPAGTFTATQVKEIVTSCPASQSSSLLVYEMDRWYVPGLGPVKMTYEGSDSLTREYDLVSSQVASGSEALWPLDSGDSWTYQTVAPDGGTQPGTTTVSVTSATAVSAPDD